MDGEPRKRPRVRYIGPPQRWAGRSENPARSTMILNSPSGKPFKSSTLPTQVTPPSPLSDANKESPLALQISQDKTCQTEGNLQIQTKSKSKDPLINRGHYGNKAYDSLKSNDFSKAIKYADWIARGTRSEKFEALLVRSEALLLDGQIPGSLRDCYTAIKLVPTASRSYIQGIKIYCKDRKYPEALDLAQMAIKEVPTSNPMYQKLLNYKTQLIRRARVDRSRIKLAPRTLKQTWVSNLPYELIVLILSELPVRDFLKLTLVCRKWRQELCSIPGLWENIRFNLQNASPRPTSDQVAITLDKYLGRAAHQLRSLTIEHGPKLSWSWFNIGKSFDSTNYPKLTRLNFSFTRLHSSFIIPLLNGLGSQLQRLEFVNCSLDDALVSKILNKCPNLLHLDLGDNSGLTLNFLVHPLDAQQLIRPHPLLTYLGLSLCRVVADLLPKLPVLFPNLRGLDMARCVGLRVAQLPLLPSNLTHLKVGHLTYMYEERNIMVRNFIQLLANQPELKLLHANQSGFITDQTLANSLPATITDLNLASTRVTAAGLTLLLPTLTCLTRLDLSSCSTIASSILLTLHTLCPQLTHLNISRLGFETSAITQVMINLGDQLSELSLVGCPGVTSACFRFTKMYRCLTMLDVTNCPLLSSQSVAELRAAYPYTTIKFFSATRNI